jgi:tetratricopeptide (TPR) repeat protein
MRLQPQPQPPAVERGSDPDLLPKVPDAPSFEKQAQVPEAAGIAAAITRPRPPDSTPQSGPGGPAVDAATRANRIAELFQPKAQTAAGQPQPAGSGDLPALQRIKETAAALEAPASPLTNTPTNPAAASTSGRMEAMADVDGNEPGDSRPKPSVQSTADRAFGKPDAVTIASQERADRHIKAAELYLQRGQYERAAELFSLAALYNPADRRAPLGRSHALFAAGQFVNSAMLLAKAIELDPGQTVVKLDLVNATGGPDLFLRRITELEQYARANGTPDVQLLLAYIYYEMDRPEEAKTAVEAAANGLPYLHAANLLKAAITK